MSQNLTQDNAATAELETLETQEARLHAKVKAGGKLLYNLLQQDRELGEKIMEARRQLREAENEFAETHHRIAALKAKAK